MWVSRTSRAVFGGLALVASIGSVSTLALAQPRQPASTSSPAASQSSNGVVIDKQGPGMPPVDAQQTPRNTNHKELFRVLGLSAQVSAPVTPAYNADSTYTTFAGQPGRGQTAILAQSMNGSP